METRRDASVVSSRQSGHSSADPQVLSRLNAALEAQARSIGQALHDESGQVLVAAHNSLAEAIAIAPAPVGEHLVQIKEYLDTIEQQLRSFAHELRPRVLDELGLAAAIRCLAASPLVSSRLTVAVACRIDSAIPAAVEAAVYRFVQEALANIGRHSRATHVLLEVYELPGVLRCRVSDNGIGFDTRSASGPGLGLLGVRERFAVLGARFEINAAAGGGTDLVATVPLEKQHDGAHSPRRRPPGGTGQPPRDSRTREVRDRR